MCVYIYIYEYICISSLGGRWATEKYAFFFRGTGVGPGVPEVEAPGTPERKHFYKNVSNLIIGF